MKNQNTEKLDHIVKAVANALDDLLAHLKANELEDWLRRYAEIQKPLDCGDYAEVVKLVKTNADISLKEADRMNLICHYLDTPPPEEIERLAEGHANYGKYHQALYQSFLLRDLCNRSLRVYLNYELFNDPEKIIHDNKQMQAFVASASKPNL